VGARSAAARPDGDGGSPLDGLRVVVTRGERQAGGLLAALRAAGAVTETLPLLAVLPPHDESPLVAAAAALATYRWVVFTSVNAVEAFTPRVGEWPAALRLAAVGAATARALAERALAPSLVASQAQAEGLLAELLPRLAAADRVLLPQAADARTVLADGLRRAGYPADVVVAYRKERPADAPSRAATLFPPGTPLGWVTFTSPSIARAFAGLFADWPERRGTLRAASIGPVTSATLRELGVEPAAEAAGPSDGDLVAAIARAA
jgi:uroporphyrinogen-III synthase